MFIDVYSIPEKSINQEDKLKKNNIENIDIKF